MEPAAKYHWAEVVLRHGAWDQPNESLTVCVTATPPPAVITVSASQDPDERAGIAGVATPPAGTPTAACAVAPLSVTAVIVAVTGRVAVLVRMRKPGDTPPAVDWPVQYQADDSASGAPTIALGEGAAVAGAGAPRTPSATATPATTSTTRASTRHRRSRLRCAGVTSATDSVTAAPVSAAGGRVVPELDDARTRRRPMTAPVTTTHAASSSRTANGMKGNCDSDSVAWPLSATAYCAAQPKAACRAVGWPSTVKAKLPAGA